MKKLWNYNKFKFLNDNLIREYSEFNQYQLGIDSHTNPLGPGFGFAIDPSLSIYGTDQDSPYTDYYSRTSSSVSRLNSISKSAFSDIDQSILRAKQDAFIEDLDNFSNFKILRIFKNDSYHLDVFISFYFGEEEFFGVFKDFDFSTNPQFRTDMYSDPRYFYMDKEYRLKLSKYLENILDNWFRPKKEFYKNLKEECPVKDDMGTIIHLKKNSTVSIKGVDYEKDGNPYIIMKQNDKKYYLKGINYFFFNYWFEEID